MRIGVGFGLTQQPCGLVGTRGDRDRVVAALAHLPPVGTQQNGGVAKQRLGLGKHGMFGCVSPVEASRDDPGLLDVGELVSADRNDRGLAEEDVGGLVDRVRQHQPVQRRHP